MSSATEAPASDKKADAASGRRRMGGKSKMLLIIFTLLAMAFLRTGFVFLVVGLLPSIVVYLFDQSKNRYTFKTIFYCNLSGVMPFVAKLLKHGPNSADLQQIMEAPSTWIIMYGAAAMGGLLIAITPQIASAMIGSLHQTQVNRLQRAQKKIEGEWGKEVTQFGSHGEAQG